MALSSTLDWAELKREAASVERSLEASIAKYVRVETDKNEPEYISDQEMSLEAQIESLLRELGESVEKLLACGARDRPATSSAQIQRLREVLFDQKTKFRAAQNRLKQIRESETLRKLMQRDFQQGNGHDMAQEHLMRERDSIANSSRTAGQVIDNALEIHSELLQQRKTFTGTTGRLLSIGRQVPGISVLIQRIENKRTRDNTILALIIAICICLTGWYWLRGWGI